MELSERLEDGHLERVASAELILRNVIQAGLNVNANYPDPDEIPCWLIELKVIQQALDAGDRETLRRYAEGLIAPTSPYRPHVAQYIKALDS